MAQPLFKPIVLFNDLFPNVPSSKQQPHTNTSHPPPPSSSSSSFISDSLSIQLKQQTSKRPPYHTLSNPLQSTQQHQTQDRDQPDNNAFEKRYRITNPQDPTSRGNDTDMDIDMDMDVDTFNSNSEGKSDHSLQDHGGANALDNNDNVQKFSSENSSQERDNNDPTSQPKSIALSINILDKTNPSANSSNCNSSNSNHNNNNTEESTLSLSSLSPTTIVSPPSSYSSNSSSMDALAKSLSPAARVDLHRKKIQRMLQQNSLLWWELVRYTRNLERKEREQEQEQEKEGWTTSSNPSPASRRSRIIHHYHHYHHHHQNASLPPLDPQQQTTSSKTTVSIKSKSRRRPNDNLTSNTSDRYQTEQLKNQPEVENPTITIQQPLYQHDQNGYQDDHRMREIPMRETNGYSPSSRSPSPISSSSPMKSFETTINKHSTGDYDRPGESSRLSQNQPPPCCQQPHQYGYQPHLHGRTHSNGSHGQHSRDPYNRSLTTPEDYSAQRYRSGSRHDSGRGSSNGQSSMDIGGASGSVLPSSLTSANNIHSTGPSSTSSSPRLREIPSTFSHLQHHQHYQHQRERERESSLSGQHDRPLYHSKQHEVSWKGSPSTSSSLPHQRHQQLPTRLPHTMDSLPRPVPVKPSAFTNPTVSSSTGSSGLPNQTSSLDSHASASKPTPDLNEDNDNDINSGNGHGVDPNRKRRGNLPKSVTAVLKSWLVQNATHPYPTEEEKTRLSEATQLSMNQISNWFINARRRILQPILVEAAAAAVAGTDAPMDNVLIVRKGKGSRMQVEMECACISDTTGQNQDPGHEHGQSQDQNQTHDHSHPQTD